MKYFCIVCCVALVACDAPKPEVAEAEPVSAEVTLALAIAKGIDAAPAAVDSVLQANGLTRAGFDSLLYRIAEDGALSAQYTAGRR